MVCIDAIDIELIGEVQKLIVPIEIWACDTWKERAKNDFLVLELERQVIKFCDGFTLICHIGECEH